MSSNPFAGRVELSRVLVALAVVLYATVFWSLRLDYWNHTTEAPFSDLADYVAVAQRIADDFFFGLSDQYYSYWTPVTPSIIAVAIETGGINFEVTFRVIVQATTFFGSLLLAYEIVALTAQRWLGAALLVVIALSRASIFWSLKLGTEPVSEALLICAIGTSLHAFRTRSLMAATGAGAVCLLLALNRPQFLASAMLVGFCLILAGFSRTTPGIKGADRRRLLQAACFAIGVAVVWSPWIVRNYIHYHAFIPTATSGAEALFWEYQGAPIRIGRYDTLRLADGTAMHDLDIEKLKRELSSSPNDYVRSRIMLSWGWSWLEANWQDFPRLFVWRLKQLIFFNGASGLTHVPRDRLFEAPTPGFIDPFPRVSWIELFLLDKSPLVVFLALGGALLLIARHGVAGLIVTSLWLFPWFVIALAVGYERYVESMISFTMWLAVYCGAEIVVMLTSLNSHTHVEQNERATVDDGAIKLDKR